MDIYVEIKRPNLHWPWDGQSPPKQITPLELTTMKRRAFALLALLTAASMSAMAPRPQPGTVQPPLAEKDVINNESELRFGAQFFSGKVVIPMPAAPIRCAGAIAWIDKEKPDRIQYTPLLPKDPPAEATSESSVVFESIVDRKIAGSISYLAFISGSMENEDKAAVSITSLLKASGRPFLALEVQKEIRGALDVIRKDGRQYFYLENIQLVGATSSLLRKQSGSVKGAFFVTIDGATYSSQSRTVNTSFVAADYIEIDDKGRLAGDRKAGPEGVVPSGLIVVTEAEFLPN